MNVLYVNASGCDLRPFHEAIAVALRASGALPEQLSDLFAVTVVDPAEGNLDGSPRYVITAA